MIVAPASSGAPRSARRPQKPSRSGHVGIEQHERNGLPSRGAQPPAPRAPPRRCPRRSASCATAATCSCRMRRFTALSSTIRTGTCASDSGCAAGSGDGDESQVSNDAVKWNVLPAPGSLSTQIRPPIICTSVDGDRQPEPGAAEPPRRRAVGLAERLEDGRVLFRRDADAGVGDHEVQPACTRRRAPLRGPGAARGRAR